MNRAERVKAGLEQLAERFGLPPEVTWQLDKLLEIVATDPLAPTAVRERVDALDTHVADALVGLELQAVRSARRIADLGSGAGFPGLVLAAALPEAEVALVESSSRKCAFLDRAIARMGLANAAVVCERAESWGAGTAARDLVTARAVAPLNVLVEYAAPLLAPGGALVAWKGRRDEGEEADAAAAAAVTGLEPAQTVRVHPWSGAEHLHLHVFVKVGATPNRFPRRPGIASKRPLRAAG
ncbi:MAG: rRNA (guanine527-N7)-methyltransferase [Solirubrobacteraceae bacterium]|nr:rRNA (guanine527-N7)-methyltransferase [Solirubrobacteraceae bacterium]